MSPRTVLSTVALALAAVVVLVAPATAGTTYKTSISMSSKFPAFHGKLHSPYAYCTQNRKVKVYREKLNGKDVLLASDLRDSDGSWEAPIGNKLTSGSYYSSVAAKHSAEVGVTCKAAKSKVTTVD
jgi:hypothetical protein